jgi:hypothetical protein
MVQNGLSKRLSSLEAVATVRQGTSDAGREIIVAKILEQADRMRSSPAPPPEQQSPIEQIIRGALADAEGAVGAEYVLAFWRAFTTRGHAWRQGGVL